MFLKSYLAIRKSLSVIREGSMEFIDVGHDQVYVYLRTHHQDKVLTIASFSDKPVTITLAQWQDYSSLIQNEKGVKLENVMVLPPYYGGMFINRYANN
jgi:hypothetical protein